MMAIVGGLLMFAGLINGAEHIAICGAIIMSSGYFGLVLDDIQKKKLELIKILIDNLRK